MKDAFDWKAEYETAEDNGEAPAMENFVADVQEDAIKSTLKTARGKVDKVKGLTPELKAEVLKALEYQ